MEVGVGSKWVNKGVSKEIDYTIQLYNGNLL